MCVQLVQELREIAMTDAVKGKHFFLESDIKGPSLKLDNTGKALLTVSGSYVFAKNSLRDFIIERDTYAYMAYLGIVVLNQLKLFFNQCEAGGDNRGQIN